MSIMMTMVKMKTMKTLTITMTTMMMMMAYAVILGLLPAGMWCSNDDDDWVDDDEDIDGGDDDDCVCSHFGFIAGRNVMLQWCRWLCWWWRWYRWWWWWWLRLQPFWVYCQQECDEGLGRASLSPSYTVMTARHTNPTWPPNKLPTIWTYISYIHIFALKHCYDEGRLASTWP